MASLGAEKNDRVTGLKFWPETTNFFWSLVVKENNGILSKGKMMEGAV